jgi:hypothetical protein
MIESTPRTGFSLTLVAVLAGSIAFLGVLAYGLALKYQGITTPQPTVREAQNAPSSEWSTYRNERFGYNIQYPRSWILDAEIDEGDVHISSIPDSGSMFSPEARRRISIEIQSSNSHRADLRAYVDSLIDKPSESGIPGPSGPVTDVGLGQVRAVRVARSGGDLSSGPGYFIETSAAPDYRVFVYGADEGNATVARVLGSFSLVPLNINRASTTPIVGGDRDAHGCIGSAGYSWCDAKQKCLRVWEEPCAASSTEASVPASTVECFVTGGRTVVKKSDMSAMRDYVLVKPSVAGNASSACAFFKESGDEILSFDYPVFVWGAVGGYIVLDTGTSPAPRGVSLYDIVRKKVVFDDTRCSTDMTASSGSLHYSVCTGEAITGASCPSRAAIESLGLTPAITVSVELNATTLTKRETGPRVCAEMQ